MNKVVRYLNWYYYGVMIVSIIALTVMYYAFMHQWYTPLDQFTTMGMVVQYFVIFDALITIPLGLYLIKWRKPQTLEAYQRLAVWRIMLVSNTMPLGLIAFYWMGGYRSMMWISAISAIAWFFTKPTIAKVDKEMTPEDPNMPTY